MSGPVRQSNLFAAEDFLKVYRSFKDVDFTAYDFDTIRSALVEYIRRQYPEDFNDFIESSEFIAIIELLSFLGTSLALRTDLNSRENFLDTADRRDSVIRLARMLSYNPKRNIPAQGLFKITGIETNAPITDSGGRELSNTAIFWNDLNNPDSYEQYITVLNSAFNTINQFGKPSKSGTVSGTPTDLYQVDSILPRSPVSSQRITIPSGTIDWDIINPDFVDGENFVERHPDPNAPFYLIYRNDSLGLDSKNTGFFLYLKQGSLTNRTYQLDFPIKNRVLEISGAENVNQQDVYFQEIDEEGTVLSNWTRVPALVGNNVIFNSIQLDQREIYNVISGTNDSIKLKFADGNFGDVPRGLYRVWFRQSLGEFFTLNPDDASNLSLKIPYTYKDGQQYTLTLYYELQETISNSVPAETNEQIKLNAPAVFFTQNRMVNAEDYNVFPLTQGNEVVKVRAINRTHAGHSRFIDINDPTGIVQNVKLFAEDGAIYKEYEPERIQTDVNTLTDYEEIVDEDLFSFTRNERLLNHFYDQYYKQYNDLYPGALSFNSLDYRWSTKPQTNRSGTGFFADGQSSDFSQIWTLVWNGTNGTWSYSSGLSNVSSNYFSGVPLLKTNDFTIEALENITTDDFYVEGRTVKFYSSYNPPTAPVNGFSAKIKIKFRIPINLNLSENILIRPGSTLYFYNPEFPEQKKVVTVKGIRNGGLPLTDNVTGTGPVELSSFIPDEWRLDKILPPFRSSLTPDEKDLILEQFNLQNDFGLFFDITNHPYVSEGIVGEWKVVTSDIIDLGNNLDIDNFNLQSALQPDPGQLNAGWLIYIDFVPSVETSNSNKYEFISRGTRYVFESLSEVRFFYSAEQKAIDNRTGKEKRDRILVLDENDKPTEVITEVWQWNAQSWNLLPTSNGVSYPENFGIVLPTTEKSAYKITTDYFDNRQLSVNDIDSRGVLQTDGSVSGNSFQWIAGAKITIEYNINNGNLDEHIPWDVYRSYLLEDGYLDQTKIEIRPADSDEDGVPDEPLSFEKIVEPTDYVYFEQYTDFDGYEYFRPWKTGYNTISGIPTASLIDFENEEYNGLSIKQTGLFIFESRNAWLTFIENVENTNSYIATGESPSTTTSQVKTERQRNYAQLLEDKFIFVQETGLFYKLPLIVPPSPPGIPVLQYNVARTTRDFTHFRRNGRTVTLDTFKEKTVPFWFQWKHYSPLDNRIDPSVSNIIDMYILTSNYYNQVLVWKEENKNINEFPKKPSTEDLRVQFGDFNKFKMLSDQIIYQPADFKIMFGAQAPIEYRATFKVVKLPSTLLSDSEIKSRVIKAIDEYFSVENWDFGESFYYTELAAYIHQQLSTLIASVVVVPEKSESQFGDLFQVKAEPTEMFLSTARVQNVEIVESLTDVNLRLK